MTRFTDFVGGWVSKRNLGLERERERVISNGQKENLSLRFEREKSGNFFQIEHFKKKFRRIAHKQNYLVK